MDAEDRQLIQLVIQQSTKQDRHVGRRRFVARGVLGGYCIWDNKVQRWWGDHYELCPDDLPTELIGGKDNQRITELLRRHRTLK